MENLVSIYQQRLSELNQTFLGLLQQFQNNHMFLTPQLIKYRIEYLGDIIQKTLENDQQKLIQKLYKQIQYLRDQNHKLAEQLLNHQQNTQLNNITQTKFYPNHNKQSSQRSTKVSSNHKQTNQSNDSIEQIYSSHLHKSKLKNRKNTVSSMRIKLNKQEKSKKVESNRIGKYQINTQQLGLKLKENNKQGYDLQDDDEINISMNFKYLKL